MATYYYVRELGPEGAPYEGVSTRCATWEEAKAYAEGRSLALGEVVFVDQYEESWETYVDDEFGPVELENGDYTDFYAEYYDGEWDISGDIV